MKNAGDIKTKLQSDNKTSAKSGISTMKKETKQLTSSDQILEPPYWILQVVTNAQDAVEICQDKSREQKIILLKESWWSKDPNRFERGKSLREDFLNTHTSKIESNTSLNQNEIQLKLIKDEETEFCPSHTRQYRTLKPPKSRHHLLALDLTEYMRKDETENHVRIKTKNDDEIQKNQQTAIIIDSQANYFGYLKNLTELMNKQLRRYLKQFGEKEENFLQRRTFVDAVYETRKICINNLKYEKAKNKAKGKKD